MTMMSDLSPELFDEILFRVPLKSLGAVRLTSKQWNASSKDQIVCKARARHQFWGFTTMGYKVFSVRFHGDFEDFSIKQISKLDQFKLSQTFYHCKGLLLGVTWGWKKLVVWNPYLDQTRIIKIKKNTSFLDNYGIGYDSNSRCKILRTLDCGISYERIAENEIYDFDSNSWRDLDVTPDWTTDSHGVSLKGRTYWIARGRSIEERGEDGELPDVFLLYFDFTRERFGPRLKLPFKVYSKVIGRLSSCVREEQLAVLFYHSDSYMMGIWVTTKIELEDVSWNKFLVFDMTPSQGIKSAVQRGSFFIDEEKKVAMLFYLSLSKDKETQGRYIVYIIGEDGYYKEVDLQGFPGCPSVRFYAPIVCSYVPSLVQIEETATRKRKRG